VSEAGRDDPHPGEPSYLCEMLFSQGNLYALLGTLSASALLSIPYGFAGAALPLVFFTAGEMIASLFIPSSASFRHAVDRKRRLRRRKAAHRHVRDEIEARTEGTHPNWSVFDRMVDRAASLREMLKFRGTTVITENEVERMEDAAYDFLSLWLASLSIQDRLAALKKADLDRRLESVDRDSSEDSGGGDRASFDRARADLQELIARRQRLLSRRAAVDAAILALPDAVEEIYQSAITAPIAGDVERRLQDAVDRLNIEAQLEQSYREELGELPAKAGRRVATQR
jgi:dsDNA-binding SOS-regulon protein